MRIPSTASPEIQQAFREVFAALDPLTVGPQIDLKGRRVINAGDAVKPQDYATLAQVTGLITGPLASISPTRGSSGTTLYGTHATKVATAPSPDGTLFIETDRGNAVYQAQNVAGAAAWVWVGGGPFRAANTTLATTALGVNDTGYLFYAINYGRTWRWTGSAWADAPGSEPRLMIAYFTVPPDQAVWQLCDGSTVTMSTPTCGTTSVGVPNLTGAKRFLRSHTAAGGTGGLATLHTHPVDPPNTTSGGQSSDYTATVAVGAVNISIPQIPHTHDVNIASFSSGTPSGTAGDDALPPYYEALPYIRL